MIRSISASSKVVWGDRLSRVLRRLGSGGLALSILFSSQASGFMEEPNTSPSQSTIHYALTRALAVCAGFGQHAETVATYSELTDLGQSGGYSGSLCDATMTAPPSDPTQAQSSGATLRDLVPGSLNGCVRSSSLTFPSSTPGQGEGCFTSRNYGHVAFFHFPNSTQLSRIRSWAFTSSTSLVGDRKAYYGGMTNLPLSWRCEALWTNEKVNTGSVKSGTLQALGIYLHSLADRGSHTDCIGHAVQGMDSGSLLTTPSHHGTWGEDQCAVQHHGDEFTQFSNSLGEAPIYRTLETILGRSAMLWLYNNQLPYNNSYNFPGLYTELLAWRSAYPSLFSGAPRPIPMNTNNATYQGILTRVQGFMLNHTKEGWQKALDRIADAYELEAFCNANR